VTENIPLPLTVHLPFFHLEQLWDSLVFREGLNDDESPDITTSLEKLLDFNHHITQTDDTSPAPESELP
jgi:hypothetical protein